MSNVTDPAIIIADLLATSLFPQEGWASARQPYVWEREGLEYLLARKIAGDRPPISAWTAKIVDEGYPAAKSGSLQGKFWRPAA